MQRYILHVMCDVVIIVLLAVWWSYHKTFLLWEGQIFDSHIQQELTHFHVSENIYQPPADLPTYSSCPQVIQTKKEPRHQLQQSQQIKEEYQHQHISHSWLILWMLVQKTRKDRFSLWNGFEKWSWGGSALRHGWMVKGLSQLGTAREFMRQGWIILKSKDVSPLPAQPEQFAPWLQNSASNSPSMFY